MANTRTPRRVGDLLTAAVPQLSSRLTEERLRRSWPAIVGAEVARRARPQTLKDGRLSVAVDNSPWLHELTLRGGALTTRLQAEFAEIRDVRFVLAPLPDEPAPASSASRRHPLPLTPRDRQEIDDAVSTISDADVADAARRLMMRARRFPSGRGAAP